MNSASSLPKNGPASFVQRIRDLIIESDTDPVLPLLNKLASAPEPRTTNHKPPITIIIAGIATTRGQKIHNQLAALAHTSDADEHLVFMDADARPKPHWLRTLVKPFSEADDVGATTGFRFYVPAPDEARKPAAMASVLNASIAALLGPGWRNIAWGGSMAIRRKDFFAFGIDDAWQNALSDDYVLSWCVKTKHKRRIQFLQTCLVPSTADFTWPSFFEFAVRQYKITRICAPAIWLTALGAPLLYLSAFAYTLSFYLYSLLSHRPDHLLLLMFFLLYAANVLRGHFLLQGAKAALPACKHPLRAARIWYTLLYPLSFPINLLALLRSALGNTLTWRHITYTMHSRLKTTVHSR